MNATTTIPTMIVEDLIDQFPETIAAFVQRRMQCVGCPMARFETVAEVCEIYRLPLDPFVADLIHHQGTDASSVANAG